MDFRLENHYRNVSESELIEDLKRVHSLLSNRGEKLTYRAYDELGKYTPGTISRRFGTWNNALIKSGLPPNETKNASHEEMMKNIETVWIALSRQPVSRDMKMPLSKFGYAAYKNKYGTWRKALETFVDYISSDEVEIVEKQSEIPRKDEARQPKKRRTTRHMSERMRFRILLRDGFTCQSCGASPLKSRSVELHVDHIIPWSKGGETVVENLQTKCSRCNYGKGDVFKE